MRNILIPIHTNTYLAGMLPLALALKKSGEFVVIFLFTRDYPTLQHDVQACAKETMTVCFGMGVNGISELGSDHIPKVGAKAPGWFGRLKKYVGLLKLPSLLFSLIFHRILPAIRAWEIFELSRQVRFVRGFIINHEISLLVLPSDNRYDLAAYVKVAHLEHIGVVVVPQFMAGPLEWAEYVWDKPVYQVNGFLNRMAITLYPRWGILHKGHSLVALPGDQILARELLGIAPPLPWVLHSGQADAIALESDAVRDYCIAEGLASDKLVVTGSVALDSMFDVMSARAHKKAILCRKLGLPEDLPILLTALPPDSLYMGRPECDFKTYDDLVEFWCRSLMSVQGYNHIVVLHPSVSYEDLKHIEKYGLKIVTERTMNIIPLCDIFVASISSVIQWAIACAIPVLNYDVYRYRYTDYANVPGVLTMEEQQDFIDELIKLASNSGYYAKIKESQIGASERWGVLDGKAYERLHGLLDNVYQKYKKVR
ncbi:MAG: hypothetical protein NTW69_00765 [Chloroflexi bacterium]|nr:hypothetical protein [Chloroflexota bacterium]